jgi:hypothetical protein
MINRKLIAIAFGLGVFASYAVAQSVDTYSARLGWVPISLSQQNLVGGRGSATAALSRGRLSIAGTFEGLPSAATVARLHQGTATGARGPVIAELNVSQATAGTLDGQVELDRAQRAALLAGHFYIQLYAQQGVPDNNAVLRGWLLGSAATSSPGQRK